MERIKLLLCFLALSGCSSSPQVSPYGASGLVWCNDTYLRERWDPQKPLADQKHLDVAKAGYMYAVAGALVLQGESDEDHKHYFVAPKRLVKVKQRERDKSGFEVSTFELYSRDISELEEVIIAFTGSNDSADWLWTNLFFSKKQYELAREYTKEEIERYPQASITLVGYSLGGALGVHVAKQPNSSPQINKVWVFNPSPKIYADGDLDDRIWLAAVRGEALAKLRSPAWFFWPGVDSIGSPSNQTAEDYYLVRSNPIYGHFRWVLARNMLHMADLAFYIESHKGTTEPQEILEASSFEACDLADKSLLTASK